MKMLRLVSRLISIIGLFLAQPAFAWSFSARDVMAVCMSLSSQPERVYSVLEAQGWERVSGADLKKVQTDLGVAYIATNQLFIGLHGLRPKKDKADWEKVWPMGQRYISRASEADGAVLFFHAGSGASLLTHAFSPGHNINFDCLLAVPESQLNSPTYFPKLNAPTAPVLSSGEIDLLMSEGTRTNVSVEMASIAPEAISTVLKIETRIGAAFSSSMSVPKSTLEP